MKVRANYGYGYVGTYTDEVLEFDDDATDEEINDYIWELATERVDVAWEKIEEEEEDEEND